MVIRQFEVFKNPRDKTRFPYLLVVQHDLLDALSVRVVVPLTPQRTFAERPVTRLNPVLTVEGSPMVMLTQLLGSVRASTLGKRVASLGARRTEIIGALDVLFTGI